VEILLEIAKFAIIFGILATVPLVTWVAVAWLFTDRRRNPSRPDAS
jgi:hypothetical protein